MLIITGTIAYDFIMDFPGKFADHIDKDKIHQLNLSFIVQNFAKRRGGTAGNTSYSLGLLGVRHILFSVAGSDFEEYGKKFNQLGIDTSQVQIFADEHSSTGFAMTDASDNQIWGYFYGASEHIKELRIKNLELRNQERDLVLIGPSGAEGSMSFVRQCVEQNLDFMFDPGFILTQIKDDQLKLGVEHAKYLIGNDYEINLIRKRIKDADNLFKKKIVITTLGEKGAVIEDNGNLIPIDSVKISKAVDPTGAGDAWRAGFLTGLEKGFDLKICGQMGSVAAAYAVEHYGTQEHSYTKEEFVSRYRQNFPDLLEL